MKKNWILILKIMLLITIANTAHAVQQPPACTAWPLWHAYLERFVQDDGRVIDFTVNDGMTSSEGQAYSLFFALVADDKEKFDTLLTWTEAHLANGDFQNYLPGWKWGENADGQWTILDSNAASDADMWLAYTLLQAGRLWKDDRYSRLGMTILSHITQREVSHIPGLGVMLLPGPEGFANAGTEWKFNPSYLPIQQLRYFSTVDETGPWNEILNNSLRMLQATSPHKVVADWVTFKQEQGWVETTEDAWGSYDALRTYLWAGMLNASDPVKPKLLRYLSGMRQYLETTAPTPPLRINALTGEYQTGAPAGFSAALLPYLKTMKASKALENQERFLSTQRTDQLIGIPPTYYDQVLSLFGLGWEEGRFEFGAQGELHVRWQNACQ